MDEQYGPLLVAFNESNIFIDKNLYWFSGITIFQTYFMDYPKLIVN